MMFKVDDPNKLNMIKNYFKTAWRSLWKHRQTTFINIAGLTIGMAAAVLITLWVKNELSFDNYHTDADRIYRVKSTWVITKEESWLIESSQYILGDFAKKQVPEIENVTRVEPLTGGETAMHYNGKALTVQSCAYVDPQWFNFFKYNFIQGNAQAFLQNPAGMIITVSAAKKYLGSADAVGKIIRIDSLNYQVRAVVQDNPANSSFQFEILLPIASRLADAAYNQNAMLWGNYNYLTFFKLKPGANLKRISTKLDAMLHKNDPKNSGNSSYSLINVRDMHFESGITNSSIEHGNINAVKIFSLLAILLIVTACINYVNLTTARSSIRSKEVSVRKVVGAGRGQLFAQFMTESFLISLISVLFAIVLVQLCIPAFNSITDKHFVAPFTTPATWLILIGTLLASFILNGIYPAILLSSFKPMNVFRGQSLLTLKDTALRRTLVVVQFAISVILIIGTIVIYRQLNYMQKINLGYNRSHIFTFRSAYWRIPGFDFKKTAVFLNSIRHQLDQQTAFAEVAQSNSPIVNFTNATSGSVDWKGRPKDYSPSVAPLNADVDFEHMMQLKMQEGHWFTKADQHNVILNETAVKLFKLPKPVIGQPFYYKGDTGQVVGIVKDFHYRDMHEKIGPMVISNKANSFSTFYIKTKPGHDQQAILAAKAVWQHFMTDQPFEFSFLDDDYNKLYLKEQQLSVLISFFAGIAIVVSGLGLLGLAAFAAERRMKEIGIRKILGATIRSIVGLLSADFVKMVLIASLISFPIAWWAMSKWLMDFAYRVDISWWIFILAGGLALAIALITVSVEAIKAALLNPVKSLRSE